MRKKAQEQGGRKKRRKAPFIVGAIVILAAAGFFALRGNGSRQTTANAVEVVPVTQKDVLELVDTSGTVVSRNKKTFFSPVNAIVKEAEFEAGDTVKSGEMLVTFELKDLEKENKKAELNIKSSQYGYEDSLNKSDEAVRNKAEAQEKVNDLQYQVDQWQQYVDDVNRQIAQVQKDAKQYAADVQKSTTDAAKEAARQQQEAAAREAKNKAADLKKQLSDLEKGRKSVEEKLTEAETVLSKIQQELKNAIYKQEVLQQTYDEVKSSQAGSSKVNEASTALKAQMKVVHEIEDVQLPKAQTASDTIRRKLEENFEQPIAALKTQMEQLTSGGTAAGGSQDSTNEYGSDASAGLGGEADITELQIALQDGQATLGELQSELASNKAIAEADAVSLSDEAKSQMEVNNNLQELESKSVQELIEKGKKGIQAEFDGVISDSKLIQGGSVVQGQEMFTLQSNRDVDVDITLSKYDFEKVKSGQKAVIKIGEKEYQGTVSKLSHIAVTNEKGTPVIKATVSIDNPDQDIFIGVDAKVSIKAAEAKQVPVVPVEAINTGSDGSFCYVIKDGTIAKQSVKTGVASDSYMEITSGLTKGEEVILDIGSFEEGTPVTVSSGTEPVQPES